MVGLEGKTLDRYQLRKLVGGGGMADVYVGQNSVLEQEVAIKVFKREDEKLLGRFMREAQFMASLQHEHLMPIYDVGEVWLDGFRRHYIVMPFIEGGTLRTRFRRSPMPSLEETADYLCAIAGALDYIHAKGIVHRDIKSSNILLTSDGHCYLSDFGIARATTDETSVTTTGHILGTADYAAPELFVPHWKVGSSCDLYSLGVLVFEMVTGELPFCADNALALVTMHVNEPPPSPRSLILDLPLEVEHVMLKALEKNPARRYATAGEFAKAFSQALVGHTSPAPETAVNLLASDPIAELITAGAAQRRVSQFLAPLVQVNTPFVSQALIDGPTHPMAEMVIKNPQIVSRPITPLPASILPPSPAPAQRRGPLAALASQSQHVNRLRTTVDTHRARTTLGRRQALTLAVVTLLALLAVALSVGGYNLLSSSPHKEQHISLTGQGVVGHKANPSSSASPTATPKVTATAQPTAQPTATPPPTPFQLALDNPTYTDPLTSGANRSEHWTSNNNCMLQQNGYDVVATENAAFCRGSTINYTHPAIEVTEDLKSGEAGLVFDDTSHSDFFLGTYYVENWFTIDTAGNYYIDHYDGSALTPDRLLQHGTSSAHQGVNTLQVFVDNGTLKFFVNGTPVYSMQEDLTSGNVGFVANSNSSNGEAVFSNLMVKSH